MSLSVANRARNVFVKPPFGDDTDDLQLACDYDARHDEMLLDHSSSSLSISTERCTQCASPSICAENSGALVCSNKKCFMSQSKIYVNDSNLNVLPFAAEVGFGTVSGMAKKQYMLPAETGKKADPRMLLSMVESNGAKTRSSIFGENYIGATVDSVRTKGSTHSIDTIHGRFAMRPGDPNLKSLNSVITATTVKGSVPQELRSKYMASIPYIEACLCATLCSDWMDVNHRCLWRHSTAFSISDVNMILSSLCKPHTERRSNKSASSSTSTSSKDAAGTSLLEFMNRRAAATATAESSTSTSGTFCAPSAGLDSEEGSTTTVGDVDDVVVGKDEGEVIHTAADTTVYVDDTVDESWSDIKSSDKAIVDIFATIIQYRPRALKTETINRAMTMFQIVNDSRPARRFDAPIFRSNYVWKKIFEIIEHVDEAVGSGNKANIVSIFFATPSTKSAIAKQDAWWKDCVCTPNRWRFIPTEVPLISKKSDVMLIQVDKMKDAMAVAVSINQKCYM